MPQVRRPKQLALHAAGVLVALVVAVVPQVAGGVDPRFSAGLCVASLVALGLVLVDRWRVRQPLRVSLVALGPLVCLGWTALTLVPLPAGVRRALQPTAAAQIEETLARVTPAVREAYWGGLHLDPPSGATSYLRLLTAVAVLLVVAVYTRHRRRRRHFYVALSAAGVLVFAVSLGHSIGGAENIWGYWVPISKGLLWGPLVNPNHLARAFGAFGLLALGRSLVAERRGERAAHAAVGLLLCMCVFFLGSRGAILALGAAGVAAAALWLPRRAGLPASGWQERVLLAVGVAVAVVAVLFGAWLGRDVLSAEWAGTFGDKQSKLEMYGPALRLVERFGGTGIGNGAFGASFGQVLQPGELWSGVSTHLENTWLAILVEYGFVAGPIALVALLTSALAIVDVDARVGRLAPLPAAVFLVVGDLVDLSLELPYGAILLATCAGLAAGEALAQPQGRWLRVPVPLAAVVVVVAAAALVPLTPLAIDHWYRASWRRVAGEKSAAELQADYETALVHHPMDGFYAYGLAVAARARRDLDAGLHWSRIATTRKPNYASGHQELARALSATGDVDAAMLALRQAWRAGLSPLAVFEDASRITRDPTKLRLAVPPEDALLARYLCGHLRKQRRTDEALACYAELWPLDLDESTRRAAISIALAADRFDVAAGWLGEGKPGFPASGQADLAARLLSERDGLSAALVVVEPWLMRRDATTPLLRWGLNAAMRTERLPLAQDLLTRLRRRTQSADARLRLGLYEVELLRRLEKRAEALRRLGEIAHGDQRSPKVLAVQLRLLVELGLVSQARRAYAALAAVAPRHGFLKRYRAVAGPEAPASAP